MLAAPHDGPAPAPAGPGPAPAPVPAPVGEGYVDPGENFVGIAPDTGPGSVAPDLLPPTNMTVFVPGSPSDPNWAGYVVPGAVGGTPLTQLDPNELARMNLKQLALLYPSAIKEIPAYAFTKFEPSQVKDLDAKQVRVFNCTAVRGASSWGGCKF